MAFALREHLNNICDEYKQKRADEAWESITHIPMACNGLLQRTEFSDEPPQAPKSHREHENIPREKWWELSPEQQELYWEEKNDQYDAAVADAIAAKQRDDLEAFFNKDTGFHKGESRHVGRTPNLDRVEVVRTPVPPKFEK